MKIARLSIMALLVLLLLAAGCSGEKPIGPPVTAYPAGGTVSADTSTGPQLSLTAVTAQTAQVSDLASLLDRLRASGASIGQPTDLAVSPFSVPGNTVRVNGSEVQVFEYPSYEAVVAEAVRLSPDGTTLGGRALNWPATAHVFQKGRLLIVYPGTDTAVLNPLEFVLGRQIAGPGQIAPLVLATATPAPVSKPATATVTPARVAATAAATPGCTDRAVLVADVTVPDGARIPAGQSFLKTWRLRNTGTCTWTPDYALVYASGPTLGGEPAVPFSTTVKPRASVDLSTTLTAPVTNGTYRTRYQLRNASGKIFGIDNSRDKTFWVEIVVRAAPAQRGVSPTPGAAATPGAVAAAPANTRRRVTLPPGATSVALTFNLAPGAIQEYVVAGQAGQLMRLYLGARGSTFGVTGPDGQELPPVSLAGDGRVGEFALPAQGDYTITLQGAGNTLTIEMPPR